MTDEQLRARIARLDPATAPVDPITSPRAQELLERTMSINLEAPTTPRQGRRVVLSAAAAAVLLVGGGVALLESHGGSGSPKPVATLTLTLPGGGGPVMSTCIQFSVDILKQSPIAFAGTVTARDGGTVTLDVTHWYRGGTADVVTLTTPGQGNPISEGLPDFTLGKGYLVTATEAGEVAICGFTGEDTPDLRAAFDQAFGAS